MDGRPCAIEGEFVAIKLAGRMEETLQAFAVRAACFIRELDRPFPRSSTDRTSARFICWPISARSRSARSASA